MRKNGNSFNKPSESQAAALQEIKELAPRFCGDAMQRQRKNEQVRSVEQQMTRNGYEVIFRGFPTLIGVKKGENGQPGELNFVYVRRKHKKKRDQLAGLTAKQRYLLKILQFHKLKVSVL